MNKPMLANNKKKSGMLTMTTVNTSWLVERMGKETHSLQPIREGVKNAVEAILATPEKTGVIIVCSDYYVELEKAKRLGPVKDNRPKTQKDADDESNKRIYKLCIIDTGIGMGERDLLEYINKLGNSGKEVGFDKNYGAGMKIAAAFRNPHGVVWYSWEKGEDGYGVHVYKDKETGEYGLKHLVDLNGDFYHAMPLTDEAKPTWIADAGRGTMVQLHGISDDHDTMKPPLDSRIKNQSRWIPMYLNGRFYEIPEGITIRVEEGCFTQNSQMRTIEGMKAWLGRNHILKGTVELNDNGTEKKCSVIGKVHWWVLKELANDSERLTVSTKGYGHTGVLYQNEIYDLAVSTPAYVRLQQFGVYVAGSRVVIYIEPRGEALTTDAARNRVLEADGLPISWDRWAEVFMENMPQDLHQFVEEQAGGSLYNDDDEVIRERLKDIMPIIGLNVWSPSRTGTSGTDAETDEIPESASTHRGRRSKKNENDGDDNHDSPLKRHARCGPVKALKSLIDLWPKVVKWVSINDKPVPTREEGDLEGRAARYILESDTLLINADYQVFEDMVIFLKDTLQGGKFAEALITKIVRCWFKQSLVESVIGAKQNLRTKLWSREDVLRATNEEALSSCAWQRYHVLMSVKREYGSQISKFLKDMRKEASKQENES